MAGLNVAMLSGKSSLLMRQEQMNVIGNNVANAGRTEYHRQTAEIVSNPSVYTTAGPIGTGAKVEDIIRRYDLSLETSYRQALQQEGSDQAYLDRIQLIEETMAPSGESPLSTAMSDFADGWQNLANRPESIEERAALLHLSESLVQELNFERTRLVSLRDNIASTSSTCSVRSKVDELNSYADSLAALNEQISNLENRSFLPEHANDLRDERDKIVADMSKLIDINVVEEADGTYTVDIGGTNLVQGSTKDAVQLTMTGGVPSITWVSDSSGVTVGGGEINGLLDAWTEVDSYVTALDTFGTELATAVNTAHQGGFDLNGNAGGALFDVSTPGQATVLITDPNELAAGNVANQSGDGTNALDVWDALNTPVAALGDDTLIDHVDRIVNDLSRDIASAEIVADGSAAGVQMYEEAIGRHSGVNVEEEMLDMLEVQRAYQASAKFIGAVDDMLGNVIAMVG